MAGSRDRTGAIIGRVQYRERARRCQFIVSGETNTPEIAREKQGHSVRTRAQQQVERSLCKEVVKGLQLNTLHIVRPLLCVNEHPPVTFHRPKEHRVQSPCLSSINCPDAKFVRVNLCSPCKPYPSRLDSCSAVHPTSHQPSRKVDMARNLVLPPYITTPFPACL